MEQVKSLPDLAAREPAVTVRARMYEAKFGLTEPPFQLTPDARFFFEGRTHKRALQYLGFGLAQGEGFVAGRKRTAAAACS